LWHSFEYFYCFVLVARQHRQNLNFGEVEVSGEPYPSSPSLALLELKPATLAIAAAPQIDSPYVCTVKEPSMVELGQKGDSILKN
jgi:hypothetical protein